MTENLRDAISGERRDWHVVEVRPDDLDALLARHAALVAAAEYGKHVGQWHDAIGSGPIDVLNDELGELRRLCVAALASEEDR